MTLRRTSLSLFGFILIYASSFAVADEVNFTGLHIAGLPVLKIDGPYTYSGDGVPLLGWIVARLPQDKVSFLLCTSKVVEIEFKELTATKGKCPAGRRLITPWAYDSSSNTIKPARDDAGGFIKAVSSMTGVTVAKEPIDVNALPKTMQTAVQSAKSDSWVGLTFIAKGKQALGIITPSQ